MKMTKRFTKGVRWVSIPLPLESQSSALPIELQTPYSSERRIRTFGLGVMTPAL